MSDSLDITAVRQHFPALRRTVDGRPLAFFDGPAGSQVPQSVIDRMAEYMSHSNANTGGTFITSRESDEVLRDARAAAADLLGTDDPDCVVFGPNMTTLTFQLSRSLARTWKPGDEIVVTRLDHDANVAPWVMAARDAGATVHTIDFDRDDTTLDMDQLARLLSPRTALVAVGAASNATGTINPVAKICELSHDVGAEVFVDAVHYAPHALIDVAKWGCDYLACSAYKFFGPHLGLLWGKRDRLAALPAYQVRPAGDGLPGRWSVGTQSHEAIAGTLAAIEYLAALGQQSPAVSRRQALSRAYRAIRAHENELIWRFLDGMAKIPSYRIWGITDREQAAERAPTVSFTHARASPETIARVLGEQGICSWYGNYYAIGVTEHLGLEPDGMVRVGVLHYNDRDEVDRLLDALRALDRSA